MLEDMQCKNELSSQIRGAYLSGIKSKTQTINNQSVREMYKLDQHGIELVASSATQEKTMNAKWISVKLSENLQKGFVPFSPFRFLLTFTAKSLIRSK